MSEEDLAGLKPNLKLKQILEMPVAFGNIYWLKEKSKGRVLIARPGDLLNLSLINKFNNEHKFYIEKVLNYDNFLDLKNKLAAYKNSKIERVRIQNIVSFIVEVKSLYFSEGIESSLLSLSSACLECFKYEDSSFYEELYMLSVPLFKRSIRFSALGAVYALALGYTDYKLIQDFYNICFYGVYGFLNDNYNVETLAILDQERTNTGTLMNRISLIKNEMHEKFQQQFSYQFIENMRKFCFEKRDGTGSPNRLSEDELNDLENIYVLLSNTLTFQDFDFHRTDGTQYIWKMLKTENAIKGTFRIKSMLGKRFLEIKLIEKSYKEIMA